MRIAGVAGGLGKNMYILGISGYSHDSSCALLHDGQIIALGEEERFNREKHTCAFPKRSIEFCLQKAGIRFEDIDHVAFFWQPWREITGNILHVARYFPASLNLLRAGEGKASFAEGVMAKMRVGRDLQKNFGLSSPPKVNFIEHHLAHAASAFYVSGFDEAAILTIDGRGESTTTLLSAGSGKDIRKIREIEVPHSLGHLYAAVTDYLGFRPFHDEWKVMGMSAYGTDAYLPRFKRLVKLSPKGYELNLDHFSFHTHGRNKWLSEAFWKEFGPPEKKSDGSFSQRAADIAFALQRTVEEAGVHLANRLYEATGLNNLCVTGGVALNCLMNKVIVEQSPFKNFFIQPIANDAGTSLGAALYLYHRHLRGERGFVFNHAQWGPDFSGDEIESALRKGGVNYRRSSNIAAESAGEIANGKIVGWFQGRMECGPRALGGRSIVADPTRPEMKDRLNAGIKRRELFRPFAPAVLEEKVDEYFIMPKSQRSPYMVLAGKVREEKAAAIPAVVHVDGTARVQTVNRSGNPLYWELIHEFEKIKGVPVLLNTSFNENEPIVCSPEEAVACFLRARLDVLAIGEFIAFRRA